MVTWASESASSSRSSGHWASLMPSSRRLTRTKQILARSGQGRHSPAGSGDDGMIDRLLVSLDTVDGATLAVGELFFTARAGKLVSSTFRYAASYLARPAAFAI